MVAMPCVGKKDPEFDERAVEPWKPPFWYKVPVLRHLLRAFLEKDMTAHEGRDIRFEYEKARPDALKVSERSNFMAWRRSTLLVLIFLGAATLSISISAGVLAAAGRVHDVDAEAAAEICAAKPGESAGIDVAELYRPFLKSIGEEVCKPVCAAYFAVDVLELDADCSTQGAQAGAAVETAVLAAVGNASAAEAASEAANAEAQQVCLSLLTGFAQVGGQIKGFFEDDDITEETCKEMCEENVEDVDEELCSFDWGKAAANAKTQDDADFFHFMAPLVDTLCGKLKLYTASNAGACKLQQYEHIHAWIPGSLRLLAILLTIVAANAPTFKRSQTLTLAAFACNTIGPIIVSAIPWYEVLGFDAAIEKDLGRAISVPLIELEYRILMGASSVLHVLPVLVAVIPGVLNAAVLWKSMLPASSVWGWIIFIMPFIAFMVSYGTFVVPMQIVGDGWFAGFNFFMTTNLLGYVVMSYRINADNSPGGPRARDAAGIASKAKIFWMVLGAVCIFMFFYNLVLREVLEFTSRLNARSQATLARIIAEQIGKFMLEYVRTHVPKLLNLIIHTISQLMFNLLACADGMANMVYELRVRDGAYASERALDSIVDMCNEGQDMEKVNAKYAPTTALTGTQDERGLPPTQGRDDEDLTF